MADIEPKSTTKDLKKRMVKALFSYTPENSDELQLKVDDVLEVIEEMEEGWWKGALNGNVGMFPSNFVIQLDPFPEEVNNKTMNELSPSKNTNEVKQLNPEDVQVLDENTPSRLSKSDFNVNKKPIASSGINVVDGNSLGRKLDCDDKKDSRSLKKSGTSLLIDSVAPQLPPKPIREQAKVMFPYTAINEDELSLKEGDIIILISKEVEDKGWWRGELNGKVGVFPDNFVELLKIEEQKKPERPDKPVTAVSSKVSVKVNSSEMQNSDCSPKHEKKVTKTPPAKPPPPDIKKKDEKPDRPVPPSVTKKPQLPLPMKKPLRPSVVVQISSTFNSVKSVPSESVPESDELKSEVPTIRIKKNSEVSSNKDEKQRKSDASGFDVIESSSDKLVHLTANRAKAPNRRPPSHIFLRENEKDSDIQSNPRRFSEPLLSELDNLLSKEVELYKANLTVTSDIKPKITSTSVTAQSATKSVSAITPQATTKTSTAVTAQAASKTVTAVAGQAATKTVTAVTAQAATKTVTAVTAQAATKTVTAVTAQSATKTVTAVTAQSATKTVTAVTAQAATKTITAESSHKEMEVVTKKTEESKRKLKVTEHEHIVILPKRDLPFPELTRESLHHPTDVHLLRNELNQLRTNIDTVKDSMVSRCEFTELLHKVNKLTDTMETYNENFNKLKEDLEMEKKLRLAAESELERKKCHIQA